MKKRNIKVSMIITILILLMQLLVLNILYGFASYSNLKSTRKSTIESMQTMVEERSMIIENYIREMERYLTAYSRAGEIGKLLRNPDQDKIVAEAQQFTETYSADLENLEGIYACEWNTHVLVHTNPAVPGLIMREGDSLKTLQDALQETDGVYSAGIIFSPASGKQVISLYRIYLDEKQQPIGFVGAGIYVTELKKLLDSLPVAGLDQAKYCLVNARNGSYIFHENEELLGTETEETYIKEILNQVMQTGEDMSSTGYLEYQDQGEKQIAAYHYIAERDWLFLITDTSDEIFAAVDQMKKELLFLCLMALILLMGVTYLIITICMRPLSPIGRTLLKIADCDISDDAEVRKYNQRRDDLGEIAKASGVVISSLRGIVNTLKECCMQLDEKVFALQDFSVQLVDGVTNNISTTEQLSASLEGVNSAVESINGEIDHIHTMINEIVSTLLNSVESSSLMLDKAIQMRNSADINFHNTKDQMEKTRDNAQEALESLNKLSEINGMASGILEIADQTNLLSINASIEAARSGEAGRGFAVVAEEIGKLADNSKNMASNIREMCEASGERIQAVNECVESILQYMENSVLESFEEYAVRSGEYSVSVEEIRKEIQKLNDFAADLQNSIGQIAENIGDVQSISFENKEAVNEIVGKSENTADIAIKIQNQAEENKQMAEKLKGIVNQFLVE